ncbi:MotA/TolQ/ExbB proton channel family protein [Methylophaga thalassica]|uniref:MotA/TolQ/ExbB proton channel family protein n=1 Tax=Methylophaga thalassica TaxID=40223 RepID=UPI002E7C02B2|nr:MotA/TolQ/ExbB proton channel family protein [Methylophaga thalassica]WVI85225.1 MotA/TolQ/ExbB proton channel family protein [Methylophaga thalassica]
MLSSQSIGVMHHLVGFLLEPVIWALMLFAALSIIDIGIALAERFSGLKKWQQSGQTDAFETLAFKRIERSDFLARIAPMLGLMGTLIPLGPGLSALGNGELSILTTAMSVAFDTTVLGLFVGIIGFVLGRLRRRWYDEVLNSMEQAYG